MADKGTYGKGGCVGVLLTKGPKGGSVKKYVDMGLSLYLSQNETRMFFLCVFF